MIKVNLLRNIGFAAGGTGMVVASDVMSPDAKRQALVKALVILVGPLLLYAFESITHSAVVDEIKNLQSQIAAIENEKASFGSVAPRVEKFTMEKKRVDRDIGAIRDLAKKRLLEVKTLDALQSIVPSRTWLKRVVILSGIVKVEGITTSDQGVSDFIAALENSTFFSNIEPKGSSQVALPTGPANSFDLEFRVGK